VARGHTQLLLVEVVSKVGSLAEVVFGRLRYLGYMTRLSPYMSPAAHMLPIKLATESAYCTVKPRGGKGAECTCHIIITNFSQVKFKKCALRWTENHRLSSNIICEYKFKLPIHLQYF